jgi:transposase
MIAIGIERSGAHRVSTGTVSEPEERSLNRVSRIHTSEIDRSAVRAVKEAMMAFFGYHYERPARKHFRWWHNWAQRSRLRPMIEKARMIKRRFQNLVTYLKHRITNAASESINAKIQWFKYTAASGPKTNS